jgi:hypothetical protein
MWLALACPPIALRLEDWCLASTNPAPAWTRALYELAESISAQGIMQPIWCAA